MKGTRENVNPEKAAQTTAANTADAQIHSSLRSSCFCAAGHRHMHIRAKCVTGSDQKNTAVISVVKRVNEYRALKIKHHRKGVAANVPLR